MTTHTIARVQTYTLPDGRAVECTNRLNMAGIWEEFSSGVYQRCVARLRASETVVDVGAHVGLISMLISDSVGGVRVVACEPAPPTFACLQRNFTRYLPESVMVNVAVGAEPGTAVLTYYPHSEVMTTLHVDDVDDCHNIGAALTSFGVKDPKERDAFVRICRADAMEYPVPVVTLAQLFADYDVREVGLLKIDVERGELDVLRGLDDETWPRVRNIAAEVHDIDGRLGRVVAMLEGKGFHVDDIQHDIIYRGGSTHMVIAGR